MKGLERFAPLPLRLMLGVGFIYHGYPKLFTAEGNQSFQGMLEGIGVPAAGLMSYVVGLVEVGGGLALLLGTFTAIAGSLLVVNMLVAAFTVHLPAGFNFMNITGMGEAGPQFGMPGYETPLLYAAAALALVLSGPGALALDTRWRSGSAEGRPAPRERVGA